MSLKGKTDNIFRSTSQLIERDPLDIVLLEDRLLIRDLEDPERIGSIHIPQTAAERGVGSNLRLGVVVKVGPGNKFIETGIDDNGFVKRRAIKKECDACHGTGESGQYSIILLEPFPCRRCGGAAQVNTRVPTTCQVGDTVIYDRRREAEFFFNGQRYFMVYEEQSVVCIVDSETAATACRWCLESKPEWSYAAKVWIHRCDRLDRRCDNPPNDYGYTTQVPEETISLEARKSWKATREGRK